jgi:hypothetical protein
VSLGAIAIGFVAGGIAGMFGVGGGVVFVPGLVIVLGLNQVDAEATSLLAIVPVALVGAWRQHNYGNLRLREGVLVGALAVPFAALGVVIVNAVPERAIELAFAALIVYVAIGLLRSDARDEGARWDERQARAGLARAGVRLHQREEARGVDRLDVGEIDAIDVLELGDKRLQDLGTLSVQIAVKLQLHPVGLERHIRPQPLHATETPPPRPGWADLDVC